MSADTPVGLRISRYSPLQPWSTPGSRIQLEVVCQAQAPLRARLDHELLDLDHVVERVEQVVRLPSGRSVRRIALRLPPSAPRGYGLRLLVTDGSGRRVARATSAVEALDGWWQAPRHACLTDFAPGIDPTAAVQRLADWHVTALQFYDWMWRHYRYRPPAGDEFLDTLGRRVSHATVRRAIRAAHRYGLAALAYGSVYGAEREYADRHPEQLLRDTDGTPLSLAQLFFITDLRPGSAWRRQLLREYVRACREFGFDGIHMDQYGQPRAGITADGERLDLARTFPGLVAEADRRLRATHPSRRVLFNLVGGWPLPEVARAPSAATYIEVWPPDVSYADIVRLVESARAAAPERAVILAAYLSVMGLPHQGRTARAAAAEAAVLLSSIVLAAGAHHHVLAEGDRVLTEGYYPTAAPMRRVEAEELRAAWVFAARYGHLLGGPGTEVASAAGYRLLDARGRRVPTSTLPLAGHVWLRPVRSADGTLTLSLLDLRGQRDDRWDAPRTSAPARSGWRLDPPASKLGRWLLASPWSRGGDAVALQELAARGGRPGELRLPRFRRWGLLIAPR
ncbi:MAG TPA: glycoside hydrolase family 66 protein [Candidatus Limnocylindrales bacterium]|nr:glycoside hydrolase family 66 protein [Candidatus Limnocylindrales bacterium]